MIEKKTGGCHCGTVRYEVGIDLTKPVIECNCSHCQVKGLLLSAVPSDALIIHEGEANLTEYNFNTEKIRHFFCKTCGVQPFARGKGDAEAGSMVNVRSIDDIDLDTLTRLPFDGKSR